jgi:hypothetical protein
MCTEIRDKVFALVRIASDIADRSYTIDPDYAKAPVEVLMDVIRNQCQWGTRARDSKNLKFIYLLKDVLGILHAAAGRSILEHAPDIQTRSHNRQH